MKISRVRSAGLGLLLCLGLSACPQESTQPPESPSPPASTSPESTGPPTQSAAPAGQVGKNRRRGIFVYGDGYQTFKACGSKEEVWVLDTPEKELQARYQQLKLMELEPVYVEIEGSLTPTKDLEGFASDYKQAVKVSKVHQLRTWVSDGSCFATDFIAEGTRPDWQIQVLSSGDVFFKAHEGEFPYVDTLAYSKPRQEGNRWLYSFAFRTPDQEKLEAEFTEEACQFNGKDYAFSAKIQFRGMTYTGCAHKKF